MTAWLPEEKFRFVKPDGANVVWVTGYWAWDDMRKDFIWISGIWRDTPNHRGSTSSRR